MYARNIRVTQMLGAICAMGPISAIMKKFETKEKWMLEC
jgi:hypothetical protein